MPTAPSSLASAANPSTSPGAPLLQPRLGEQVQKPRQVRGRFGVFKELFSLFQAVGGFVGPVGPQVQRGEGEAQVEVSGVQPQAAPEGRAGVVGATAAGGEVGRRQQRTRASSGASARARAASRSASSSEL